MKRMKECERERERESEKESDAKGKSKHGLTAQMTFKTLTN